MGVYGHGDLDAGVAGDVSHDGRGHSGWSNSDTHVWRKSWMGGLPRPSRSSSSRYCLPRVDDRVGLLSGDVNTSPDFCQRSLVVAVQPPGVGGALATSPRPQMLAANDLGDPR